MKVAGCIWCDMRRKGSRKVKASRNPRLHWVDLSTAYTYNGFGQKRCMKFRPLAETRRLGN